MNRPKDGEKKTDEDALLTTSEKKMFKRKRASKKTLKEYGVETLQMKSESVGPSEERGSGSYEETQTRGLRPLTVDKGLGEHFDSPAADDKVQNGFPKIEGKKRESSLFEETRKRRKDLDWQQVERFDSPQAFNRSKIKAELDQVMSRSKLCRTSEARQERYVCKFYKKAAWKPCLRKYRVSH